jgi:hypothetical protein
MERCCGFQGFDFLGGLVLALALCSLFFANLSTKNAFKSNKANEKKIVWLIAYSAIFRLLKLHEAPKTVAQPKQAYFKLPTRFSTPK